VYPNNIPLRDQYSDRSKFLGVRRKIVADTVIALKVDSYHWQSIDEMLPML
jgi:hypothetical protein